MRELKNTSHNKGLDFEAQDACDLIQNKKYRLIGHRVKCSTSELDLIFITPQKAYEIFEVKSSGFELSFSPRVSQKQALRIFNSIEFLNNKFNISLRAHLAIVAKDGSIDYYLDFLADIL